MKLSMDPDGIITVSDPSAVVPKPRPNPLRLTIGHMKIAVRPMDDAEHEENGNAHGLFFDIRNEIAIRPDDADGFPYGPAEVAVTIVHEIIHAFFYAYRIPSEGLDEETVCERLEGPLTAFIRDNQGFLSRLGKALNEDRHVSIEGAA